MPFDFAALRAVARRTIHDNLGVPASYASADQLTSATLRVRWHNKIVLNGDLTEAGYAEMIDGVNRVIFDSEELDEKGISLRRGDTLVIDGALLVLDSLEPKEQGPLKIVWRVVQK